MRVDRRLFFQHSQKLCERLRLRLRLRLCTARKRLSRNHHARTRAVWVVWRRRALREQSCQALCSWSQATNVGRKEAEDVCKRTEDACVHPICRIPSCKRPPQPVSLCTVTRLSSRIAPRLAALMRIAACDEQGPFEEGCGRVEMDMYFSQVPDLTFSRASDSEQRSHCCRLLGVAHQHNEARLLHMRIAKAGDQCLQPVRLR